MEAEQNNIKNRQYIVLRTVDIDEPLDEEGQEDDQGRHEVSILGIVCKNATIIFRVKMSDGKVKQKKSKQIKSSKIWQTFRVKCSTEQKRSKKLKKAS